MDLFISYHNLSECIYRISIKGYKYRRHINSTANKKKSWLILIEKPNKLV